MISVIISTYNRLELLKKAVESVKRQTFKDYELIVVDDGSTDNTEEWCRRQDFTYIRRTKSFGNDTRPKNRGIKASKGEYIAFLDDDNQYLPDHLQILYNEITAYPNLDAVYGDRIVIDTQNRFPSQIGIYSEYNPVLLLKRNYIDTSDILIKREAIYDVGGFDERYGKYVDWNLWLRMAKAGKIFKRVPKIITNYYIHDEMKSNRVKTSKDNLQTGQFIPEWDPYSLEVKQPYLGAVGEPKIAVYTLTMNRLEYTKDCFKSLKDKAGVQFDHFVIDQGSKDGTVEWLEEEYKPYKLIKFSTNMGISIGSNKAIEEILKNNYDIIVKYDNDCFSITEEWLKEIVRLYKTNHMVCWSPYPEGLKDNPGGAPRLGYNTVLNHLIGTTNHLGGFCHVSPVSVAKRYKWDESQPLHGMQDLELSNWLSKNMYGMCYVEDLKVEHYKGTAQQHLDYPKYFENRKNEKNISYHHNP
jgi:glycosyltransferase involved in cell wall biosynthesis